jgi:hypothetical protein
MNNIFKTITEEYTQGQIDELVQEAKSEYVYDWEDEFDSLDKAYEEQGRGEAEAQVLYDIIPKNLTSEQKAELFTDLKEHYGLSTE